MFYAYGRCGHLQRDYPSAQEDVGGVKSQANSTAPLSKGTTSATGGSYNRLFALSNRKEEETLPDVVTDMLLVFSRDVYVLLDCRTRRVTFSFPNEPAIEWEGYSQAPRGNSYLILGPVRLYQKGCLYHLVCIKIPVLKVFPSHLFWYLMNF